MPYHRTPPTTFTPWPRNPPPCNRPRSECPDHGSNYREMVRSMLRRGIEGPEELEYIWSRNRGPDPRADGVKVDLENKGVWRGLLEHFGALRGPGRIRDEEDYGYLAERSDYGFTEFAGRGMYPQGAAGGGLLYGPGPAHGGMYGQGPAGRSGPVGQGGGPRGAGRIDQMMDDDDRASTISWGRVSRPSTRAPIEGGRSSYGDGRMRNSRRWG